MKKRNMILALALALGMILCGCGSRGDADTGTAGKSGEETGIQDESDLKENQGKPEAGAAGLEKGGKLADGSEEAAENAGASDNGAEPDGSSGAPSDSAGESSVDGTEEGQAKESTATEATQGGPYGEISLRVPEGWKYETFPMDSEELVSGDYGIHFCPEGAEEGFIELAYIDFFGVCGTGLEEETVNLAGAPANIGTYDGHEYWDFISFRGQNDGMVALAYSVEGWWEEYGDDVMGILDTLTFRPDVKEGGAYVFREESEKPEIGLSVSLEKISPTGAVLVYSQFDGKAPTGELQDGADFVLEQYRDGRWEEVPVVVEGAYGFSAIAYTIPKEEVTKRELDWEWLYGQLAAGEYRIGKTVMDFRETANYDNYVIYAYFILN